MKNDDLKMVERCYLVALLCVCCRLTAVKDAPAEDSVSRAEHETVREQLEGEVNHLTQLLQGALRKQDEMALEAADAWQKVGEKKKEHTNLLNPALIANLLTSVQARENSAELEGLQEQVKSREAENQTLSSKLAESQDAVSQLKQLVENHVASEREKNKRVRGTAITAVRRQRTTPSLRALT